uniref:RING-type E3 ubiquitin transferase n=1 Tax=Chenopodium quinoa TaxID=63459 RepID=A0A803KPB9_CHEQI
MSPSISRGLEDSVIETFPKFSYTSSNDMDIDTDIDAKVRMTGECVVCLGVFVKNEILRLLPKCGHVFHADCIDTWLRFRGTCPFCRANLMAAGDGRPQEMPTTRVEVPINIRENPRLGMMTAPF